MKDLIRNVESENTDLVSVAERLNEVIVFINRIEMRMRRNKHIFESDEDPDICSFCGRSIGHKLHTRG